MALLGTLGIVEDPAALPPVQVTAELQLSAAKHLAAVRWLEQQVGQVPAVRLPDSPWVKLLAEHRKECDRLLVELARLGIELAAVRIEEEQGRLLVGLLERVVRGLGLDPMDPQVREVVRLELVAIEGGEAA